jgi:hypothetical protein
MMHVLSILLTGEWDLTSLPHDQDFWTSTKRGFIAANHAVSAAEAIEGIFELDPSLEFIPFFSGVYLLQGSFWLHALTTKLGTDTSPEIVRSCETIVRVYEAFIVALDTEYQASLNIIGREQRN